MSALDRFTDPFGVLEVEHQFRHRETDDVLYVAPEGAGVEIAGED